MDDKIYIIDETGLKVFKRENEELFSFLRSKIDDILCKEDKIRKVFEDWKYNFLDEQHISLEEMLIMALTEMEDFKELYVLPFEEYIETEILKNINTMLAFLSNEENILVFTEEEFKKYYAYFCEIIQNMGLEK